MENIADRQREFFNTGATRDVGFRIGQLRKLKELLAVGEKDLLDAVYADFGKSAFDTLTTELLIVRHDIDEAVRHVKRWSRVKRVGTNLLNFPARSYIIPEPLGVALVIGAWNYPYQLSLSPAVAAIAAGCTVVLKPSEMPAATSRAMARVINGNFGDEFFRVVEGDAEATASLLENRFDKIFFTGSTRVGKIIYEAAARNLTPVTLELGGKSPAFVTRDCDMKMTVKRLVWAKFLNAGQTCIAPDYALVDRSVEENFIRECLSQIERSDFSVDNGNYVRIIDSKNTARLAGLLDMEKVIYGGDYDIDSRHFGPTVMRGVGVGDKVMDQEIFGPILPVVTYGDERDVLRRLAELPKPLSCYIFTSDKKLRDMILRSLSFGGGCVNDAIMHVANSRLPFGGVGDSGTGSYHGEAGFRAFTHYKSVLDKPTWFESGLKYPPHTGSKLSLARRLMK